MARKPVLRSVAIAVRNLEASRGVFEALLGARFETPPETPGSEVARLEWRGRRKAPALELISPRDEEGAVARFIRKRGEGVYHMSFSVPDLDTTVARLTAAGARVVDRPSYYRSGKKGHTLREAFLHPKDAHGVLFHFVEEE